MVRLFGGLWLAVAVFAGPGMAQTDPVDPVAAPVVQQLEQQGYSSIRVEQTWLGRLRILAWLNGQQREIILHPASGEILRDFTEPPKTYMAQDSGSKQPMAATPVIVRSMTATTQAADADLPTVAAADVPGVDSTPVDPPADPATDQPAVADSLP